MLLADPAALTRLSEQYLVIPLAVIEELDALKALVNNVGRKSRNALAAIDALSRAGRVTVGFPERTLAPEDTLSIDALVTPARVIILPHSTLTGPASASELARGSSFQLHELHTGREQSVRFTPATSLIDAQRCDQFVLDTAQALADQAFPVTLYTQDMNMRVKALCHGIASLEHTIQEERYAEALTVPQIPLPSKILKEITCTRVANHVDVTTLFRNQYITLVSENNHENLRSFRYLGGVEFREVFEPTLLGIFKPHNRAQALTLDALLDDSIKLVSLIGLAGSGKTFLTLLAGIMKVVQERHYKRIVVTRPTVAVGPDIGFLPGDVDEKLDSWMYPIRDNIEAIGSMLAKKSLPFRIDFEGLLKYDQLSLQALTYMRGRSLPNQFIYVDEAQNMTPLEVKTLITRAGAGTKVILAGDPDQIDTPHLNRETNGLVVTTEKFLGDRLFAAVKLERSERSELAQRAADLL